MSSAVHRATQP